MSAVSSLPLRGLLMLALLLSALSPAFSQTKKGFKALEKGKYPAAADAFARDTAKAELRPAAYFGLAQVWADEKNPAKNYRIAMDFQAQAAAAWKTLKPAQRTPLTKEFKVSLGSIEQFRRTAATNAWKSAEKTTSLREIDEFRAVFPKNAAYINTRATKKQAELVATAAAGATDYATLSQLYSQHYAELKDKHPVRLAAVENRLFAAFLTEKPTASPADFYRENPEHPLSKDPARTAFAAVWPNAALPAQLDFLANHPASGFAPFVRQKAVDNWRAAPLDAAGREALPEAHRAALGEVEWQASGRTLDPGQSFDPGQRAVWMAYVRQTAPGYGAFSAVEQMLKYQFSQRDWSAAGALLHETKPLFPERSTWFNDRLTLVEGPEYGIKPVALGPPINSAGDEYVPVLSTDGQRLYFGADDRPDNLEGEDVFVSERSGDGWSTPLLLKSISATGNQAPLSLTADGNRMLVFDNGRPRQSDNTPGGWSALKPLDLDVSEFSWVGLVQIAANDQVMLLEARGAKAAATDLFLAQRTQSGAWGKPVPLQSLNTGGEDRTAFLHPDMRTLYFSSDGYPGLGNMDVFKTTRLDDSWQKWSDPVNLGKEINTAGQDWGYKVSTDGTTAWFATKTEETGEDIFYIALPDSMRPQQVRIVELALRDEQGLPLTEGKIVLKDPVSGAVLGTFRANPAGQPTTLTVPKDQPVLMTLEKEGFYPQSMPLPASVDAKNPTISVEWKAPRLAAGVTQVLNIFFDYDQAILRPESNAELQQIAALAQKDGYRIKLLGYTDDSGNPGYNLDLSKRRADAARQALLAIGVLPGQVSAEGFGEADPLVPNDTEEQRARNRRVMVQLLKQ